MTEYEHYFWVTIASLADDEPGGSRADVIQAPVAITSKHTLKQLKLFF